MTPPKPQTALTSILVSGEPRQAGQHPSSVWAAESTKSQDRFSGQYPFSSPPAGTSKRTSPSSGGGGGAGEGGSEGVIPNSLASYTLLSGPTSHWSFDTGPFPVLKIVAAPGPGAGGSKPLHGDRTETLTTWVDVQVHQVHRNISWKTPSLSPSSNPLSGMKGAQDPSPPPSYSLKISRDCFSLSAQLTVLWSHPRKSYGGRASILRALHSRFLLGWL